MWSEWLRKFIISRTLLCYARGKIVFFLPLLWKNAWLSLKGGSKKSKTGSNSLEVRTVVSLPAGMASELACALSQQDCAYQGAMVTISGPEKAKALFCLAPCHWHEILKLASCDENALLAFSALRAPHAELYLFVFLGDGLKWGLPPGVQTHSAPCAAMKCSTCSICTVHPLTTVLTDAV